MPEGRQPPPRKACDLCYRRKMKCDGQAPRCSTCVMYKSDCNYGAASRKTPSRKQAAAQRQQRESDLQARVQTLEAQLSAVLDKVESLEESLRRSQDTTPIATSPACIQDARTPSQAAAFDLPPLQTVLPVVENYLATFNSFLPLFHPPTLLQTIRSWYQNLHTGDPVTWALINVVIALAHHTSAPEDVSPVVDISIFVNNAQSVLTEVVMRETTLVNVQVLVGMAMLFWTSEDLGPVIFFVSTALRLAHKCGLHTRKSSEHMSPALALQRTRVFWMAYIIDRDVSILRKLAPVQIDSDIDLDLPPSIAQDGDDLGGFIFAADGYTHMNYFRARVELAMIQGKVYDCVYSASAQRSSCEKRKLSAERALRMLDEWGSRISPDFHPAAIALTGRSTLSRYLCMLYSTRLSCWALISFASASDSFHYSAWLSRVRDYGGKMAAGQVVSHAPVPVGWRALADASREFMGLFAKVASTDVFFVRMTLCAHTSSLISLIVNKIFTGNCIATETEEEIIRSAMKDLEHTTMHSGNERLRMTLDAVEQLFSYANLISPGNVFAEYMPSTRVVWNEDP